MSEIKGGYIFVDCEEEYIKFSDDVSKAIDLLYQSCEIRRKENFIKWIKQNPDYWEHITATELKNISRDIAVEVSKSLIESNIIELQVIWIYKCRHILTIDGELADH